MTNSDPTSLTIKGQLIANAPTFTTTSGNISSRTTTTASASWTPGSWTTGSDYNSPSIVSVIQEIVDQGTWASGNAIAIIITGTGHRASQAYDSSPATAAKLVVTYSTDLSISSAANQTFKIGDATTAISAIRVTDGASPTITAANDIRIRIPSSFNMTWDTSDTTASISGSASGKVSTTVSYEDSSKTLVIDVTSNFTAGNTIVVSGLSFKNFSAVSAADNLELEVLNNGAAQALDDKTIIVTDIRITSAANQDFIVGSAATAISAITITDDSLSPWITAANDIRIRIPSSFNMTWDTSDTSALFSGTASGKVANPVSYEDNGKTLVINVTSNFAAGDSLAVSELSYANFTSASYGDHLELEVDNDGSTAAEDPKYIAVGGWPASGSLLAYGEGTVITPRYRTWSGSAFSLEGSAAGADDVIKWTVLKASPVANEMILGVYSSASRYLFIQTWNGSAWTANWSTHLDYDGKTRVFDIAYETLSGDAIVVFGNAATNDLRYRKRVGGVWDGSDQTISSITPDNEPTYVKAKSHPTTDDIFVGVETEAASLYALRWNGTSNSWDNGLKTTAGVKNKDKEGFDLAFERASGHTFLIWGDADKDLNYLEFTTSWQAETIAYENMPDDVLWLVADYDPVSTSSKIAVGMLLENTTFQFGAWNGSSWVSQPAAITARNRDQRGIDVQFQKDTGQAVYVFNQSDNPKQMAWRTWSTSGFGSVTVAAGSTPNDLDFIQLKANPSGNDLMALYADHDGDLYHRYYDGSSWSSLTSALESNISDYDRYEAFMFAWKRKQPTAVDLVSFTAKGVGGGVSVVWQTGQEAGNKGFNLYRAEAADGRYDKLNTGLIPAASLSGEGRSYAYRDKTAVRGRLYYYKLEDVDVTGAVKVHGPVCVDWDGDGMPDDWEIAHGLNPAGNDANLDPDGDGVPNWLEYERGTDPFNWDSDGDGIADGAEKKGAGYSGGAGLSADAGVQVISSNSEGLTIELVTKQVDVTPVAVGGERFERLRVTDYVHGYTGEPGLAQVPVKGVAIDLPEGKRCRLEVLETEQRVLSGYRVYPVPGYMRAGEQLQEVFQWDRAGYGSSRYYPQAVAELSTHYLLRGQRKQRLMFYPLRFKAETGELWHGERIRVRVEFYPAAEDSEVKFVTAPVADREDLSARALAAAEAASTWSIPSGAAYRLSTAGEGIYRITRAGLQAAGIAEADIDALNLSGVQLFHLGTEQAIYVYDANGNQRLDAADHITFYAEAVPAAYAKVAKHNLYWLIDAGAASPRRMGTIDGTPAAGPLAVSHVATAHQELDQLYLQSAQGPDGLDRWIFSTVAMGAGFSGGGMAKDFTLSLPGALSTGALTIRLYSPYDMEHATTVYLNGTPIGTATWSGIGWTQSEFSDLALLEGANTVSLLCEGALDKTVVDWFSVDYERGFEAVAERLKFSHPSGYRYQISGFSTSDAELYDISDPAAVKRVLNGLVTGAGPYTLEVEPAGAGETRSYTAVAGGAVKTPVAAVKDRASGLSSTENAADWILITHRDVGWEDSGAEQAWVTSLVGLRQSQGMRTAVVDVQDIFDEFGYGFATPQAIKDFLAYAYTHWQPPAPQYVLLVGDTSYDYKDNWNTGAKSHVPGHLIYTEHLGETITDDWYVQVSGEDAVPDLYIGRLPANTATQAAEMVAKIVAYETAANTQRWEKRMLFVADNITEDWESVFEAINEQALWRLSPSLSQPRRFYLQEYEDEHLAVSDLTADLLSAINAGALVVNYAGHGSVNLWATERILDNRGAPGRSDLSGLTNTGRYPFVVNMACLTGYFIYPFAGDSWRSLAEGWLWPADRGAIGALMPTGMTAPEGQQILSNGLYEAIFALDKRRLGEAVGHAKEQVLANGGYEETAQTFMLFADPATALKLTRPYRPQGLSAKQQAGHAVELSWEASQDCNGRPVAGYHLYRRRATETSYTRLTTVLITGLRFTDHSLSEAAAGATYYYTVSAVDGSAQPSVLSAPAAVTVAGSEEPSHRNRNTVTTNVSCFISSASFIPSAWHDEVLQTLSLLVLVGVFWFLGKGRRNKGALRFRSGPKALEERPPAAVLRSTSPAATFEEPPLAGEKDASLEERHFVS
jgi:hypothetical protein